MRYVFTSDFHEPLSAQRVIEAALTYWVYVGESATPEPDPIYRRADPFIMRIIHLGDIAVQMKGGPLEAVVRIAQKQAAGNKELEDRLKKEAKRKVMDENLEGALTEVLFNAIGTEQNTEFIRKLYLGGVLKEPVIETGGNYDQNMAKNLAQVIANVNNLRPLSKVHVDNASRLSGLEVIAESPAFERINSVKAIYDEKSAIVLVPYNIDKEAWKQYEKQFNSIADECERRGVRTIIIGSHERLGAKRKAYMQPILDKGIAILHQYTYDPDAHKQYQPKRHSLMWPIESTARRKFFEESCNEPDDGLKPESRYHPKIFCIGGHIHEHEEQRGYEVETERGKGKAIVCSTGTHAGGTEIYHQIYDAETNALSEYKVPLLQEDRQKLEEMAKAEAQKYLAITKP